MDEKYQGQKNGNEVLELAIKRIFNSLRNFLTLECVRHKLEFPGLWCEVYVEWRSFLLDCLLFFSPLYNAQLIARASVCKTAQIL